MCLPNKINFIALNLILILLFFYGCFDNDVMTNNYFFGDSIIKRWDLKNYFPINNMINLGENGAYISDVNNSLVYPINKDDICFVLVGTNDCMQKTNEGKSEEIIYYEFISDYDELLISLKIRFNKIYIISLLPLGSSYKDDQRYFHTLYPRINNWLNDRTLEDPKTRFINAYNIFLNSNNYLSESYSQDGIHLNDFGYKLLSAIIREYIE